MARKYLIEELINRGNFKRDYLKQTTNVSLNPAIAYAINELAGLDENDRILDPCCGTATILIERQLLKQAVCLGVDIDPRVLKLAKENIDAVNVDIQLKHGDIQELTFPTGSFTKIISNLPFGLKVSTRDKNIPLYRYLAQACESWLTVGGKVIFLTNAKNLLWNAFATKQKLKFISETQIKMSGLRPSIFIYQKI